MRKLAAAILAAPVIAVFYVPVILRRSVASRIGLAIGVGSLVGLGALGAIAPAQTTANLRQAPIVPLESTAFTSAIAANTSLHAPVTLAFSAPMDARSVAGSLQIQPSVAVNLSWDASATHLTITPKSRWATGTYHTISVLAGALGASGRPMSVPARAAFLTRGATTGTVVATSRSQDSARVDSGFRLAFNGLVDLEAARQGLKIDPAVDGGLQRAPAEDGASAFVFTPTAPLQAGTAYTVTLDGVVDADGAALVSPQALTIKTIASPRVVRFRPANRTGAVARAAVLSVRFSEAMDHASTKAAVKVTADGKPVSGAISFAEKSTVVVFKPSSILPYGAKVSLIVSVGALSADGATLSQANSATFTVEAKARAAAAARPIATPKPKTPTPRPPSSGGSVGGGSWGAVETYYLRLMNCTRTGGWVSSSGSCTSPGGRAVAALKLDSGISTKVTRPYAKLLATGNDCSHFMGGNPGNRLSRAGYTSYIWAENIGCRSGNPYSAVLGSHLFFQAEKSTSGGHYVNLMNAKYDRVGIGVWVSSGRVRLVVDFYHPR